GTAVKLTTARYYTPNGRSIQAEGIVPDIELENVRVADAETTFEAIKEADLSRHLQNGEAKPEPPPAPVKVPEDNEPKESLARSDYQLYEALNLLKGLAIQQERER
ncbi:MAG TPA: S41 family peptidase, partial [Gammaproteobacteria bacterium]